MKPTLEIRSANESEEKSVLHSLRPMYIIENPNLRSVAQMVSIRLSDTQQIGFRYDPQGSTVFSVATQLGQVEIIKTLSNCCEPLSLVVAVQDDFKVLLPDSKKAVRRLSGRFP